MQVILHLSTTDPLRSRQFDLNPTRQAVRVVIS